MGNYIQLYLLLRSALIYLEEFGSKLYQQDEEGATKYYSGILDTLREWSQVLINNVIDLDQDWFIELTRQLFEQQENLCSMKDVEVVLNRELRPYVIQQMKKVICEISIEQLSRCCHDLNIGYLKKTIQEKGHKELLSILEQHQLSEYQVELSENGSLILSYEKNGRRRYLSSYCNPIREAIDMANHIMQRDVERYIICGCGFDEWIDILRMERGGMNVNVYCDNMDIILFGLNFRYYYGMELLNFHLFYDPGYELFARDAALYPEGVVIDTDVFTTCKSSRILPKLKQMYLVDMSFRNMEWKMQQSFLQNTKLCSLDNNQLLEGFKNKTVYIIAAGPSLNNNLNLLKERTSDSIILATGTVYRKLIMEGIRPDYVVILDCKDSIWNQFEKLKDETIPVLMSSTACCRVAKEYKGIKYLLCQEGYEPAEQFAKEHNLPLFPTGGSVSTIAMSVAVQSQARCIVYLGLDLAFTNNMGHAEGVSSSATSLESGMHPVEGWNRMETVLSDSKFDIYRSWFVRQIQRLRKEGYDTKIINATEGGSYIEGMEHIALKEVFQSRRTTR